MQRLAWIVCIDRDVERLGSVEGEEKARLADTWLISG